jgi:hypothetical protein
MKHWFWKGFEKRSGVISRALKPLVGETAGHVADVAGLATLAYHPVKDLRSAHSSAREKSKAKWDVAGLGMLAIPSIGHLAGKLRGK